VVAQLTRGALGLAHALLALELEGLGHDGDGQGPGLGRQLGDDGSGARARAAAQAHRQKHHVGARNGLREPVLVLERGIAPDVGIGAGAQTLGQPASDLELVRRGAPAQRLEVGVAREILDAAHACRDHPVDGVGSAASHADHANGRGRGVAAVQLDGELVRVVFQELDHGTFPSPTLTFFGHQKKSRMNRDTELAAWKNALARRRAGL
jgi:hypothetical protein